MKMSAAILYCFYQGLLS